MRWHFGGRTLFFMTPNLPSFNANAVEPVECLKQGWALIKNRYWLYVGVTLVGLLIGSVVPLGILMGPMMCGIYLMLLQEMRGRPTEFSTLFKGFDYFIESLIATLIQFIPVFVLLVHSTQFSGLEWPASSRINNEPGANLPRLSWQPLGLEWLCSLCLRSSSASRSVFCSVSAIP